VVKIVLDVNALLAQVEKGEVDVWWRAAAASAPTIKALRDWELIARPVLGQEFLAFNLSGDPRLADKRVRQALAHAIDRDAIINTVYLGYAEPNPASPLVPTHWIFKKDVTDYKYDPERAKALLDEAGWRVGPDGVRARDGQRLAFELQAAGNDRVKSAELVGSQFKQIGVETRIKTGTSATLYKEAQDGRFELRLTPYTQPFETDVRFLLYTGALENIGKWSHTEADKLMDEAAATLDPEKRKLLYDRVQEIFADELPYFPLFQTTNLYAVKKSVHNYRPNPNILNAISDFWNSYEWWKD
jgi:peptide/nickel transport system substrate-binding protein